MINSRFLYQVAIVGIRAPPQEVPQRTVKYRMANFHLSLICTSQSQVKVHPLA